MSDLARDLRAAVRDLEYSSTHVIGVGLHGSAAGGTRAEVLDVFPGGELPVLPGHAFLALLAEQRARLRVAVVADGGGLGIGAPAGR